MAKQITFRADDTQMRHILFDGDSRLLIPRYQRPYAWELDHVADFWNDLVDEDELRFIGTFIFLSDPANTSSPIEIIDGQQRLLTITILAAVIRDIASQIDTKRSELYQRKDIALEDFKGRLSWRITPGESCSEFFEQHIQNPGASILQVKPNTKEEHRIQDAYCYLRERVEDGIRQLSSADARISYLERLRDIIYDLAVIRILIDDEQEAYEVFETTNARGLELSVADLLKNLVFKKLPAYGGADQAKEAWQDITANIEATGTELRRFIRYYWISKYTFIQEKKLFKHIRSSTTDWNTFLSDLLSGSDIYRLLFAGAKEEFDSYQHGHRIYYSLFAIRLMRVTQCHVLFMAILRNYSSLGVDPSRLFELVEKFTFQYSAVCNLPGNRVERIYSRHAVDLQKAVDENAPKKRLAVVQHVLSSVENDLRKEQPPWELFLERFMELSYRDTNEGRAFARYVLDRIDHYLSTGEARPDYSLVNIEHIFPQKPSKAWGVSRREIRSYVNKLGNLTLVSKKINSEAQNRDIDTKIEALSKSALPITQSLVAELHKLRSNGITWDEKQICLRQKRMAKLAFDYVWNI